MKVGTIDADSEEPDCMRCDYCCSNGLCDKCGPEYYWRNYKRTLYHIMNEEDIHKLYNRFIEIAKSEH